MRYLGINKTPEDFDRTFTQQLNLLRLEALRLWFTPEGGLDQTELTVRMQEIAFNNAAFLARLETQMGTSTDFDKSPHADKI